MILALIATAACVIAVARLVGAERAGLAPGRFLWKPLASAAFIAVPLLGGALGERTVDDPVARWIIAGLCLGALGDVALMFDGKRGFLGGLAAFLFGHVAYVVAFAQLIAVGHWTGGAMTVVVIAVVAAAALVLRWLWPHLASLRGPVLAYIAVISAMLIGGLAQSLRGDAATLDATARGLLTAGATLFYLSDLAVAREKFVARDPRNRTLGLPVYYAAQLLFAWSIIP